MKKEHPENLINFARGIKMLGVNKMNFTVFDTQKINECSKRAKEQWGRTPEYQKFEEKAKDGRMKMKRMWRLRDIVIGDWY